VEKRGYYFAVVLVSLRAGKIIRPTGDRGSGKNKKKNGSGAQPQFAEQTAAGAKRLEETPADGEICHLLSSGLLPF